MKHAPLDRLLKLRRHREQKALEALTIRQGAHRRAKQDAEQAQTAVVQHAADSKEREHALIASLMGRDIRQAALQRLQDDLDIMAIEQSDLKKSAETAQKTLTERATELQKARKAYQDHHADVEKLKSLHNAEIARVARHRLVIEETIEEDQIGLAAQRSPVL